MRCKFKNCDYPILKENLCARHFILKDKKIKNYAFYKKIYHKFYFTNSWKKLRKIILAEQPICNECGFPAEEVDHIIDHKGNFDLFFLKNNLQGLCKSCHSRKTIRLINAQKYPKSNETIKIIINSKNNLFNEYKNLMGKNSSKKYLLSLIVKSKKTIFEVNSLKEAAELKIEYILSNKINPNFKIISEV